MSFLILAAVSCPSDEKLYRDIRSFGDVDPQGNR